MTDNERLQVAEVFGLSVSDLEAEPWEESGWHFTYWYEGLPDYAEDLDSADYEFRTAVRDCLFGLPPKHLADWELVASFSSSGETECPLRHWDAVNRIDIPSGQIGWNEDNEPCAYCEEKTGDEHGYIYLGDGWHELVYRRMLDGEDR